MIDRWYAYNIAAAVGDPRRWRRTLGRIIVAVLESLVFPHDR